MTPERLKAARRASGERSVSALCALLKLAQGPASMTALAQEMGHTTASATGIIDRLVRDELVSRCDGMPGDRRVRRVRLMPAGDDVVRSMLNAGGER